MLGDASGSMEVAINTSTILGSLLSVCLDAELVFFNRKAFPPPCVPASAADVLCITQAVIAKVQRRMPPLLFLFFQMFLHPTNPWPSVMSSHASVVLSVRERPRRRLRCGLFTSRGRRWTSSSW